MSDMVISFSVGQGRYEAANSFDTREALKASGWIWDASNQVWWTVEHQRLNEFLYSANTSALAEYYKQRAMEQASLAQSRSMASDLEIPCSPGLTYLPFQKAGVQFAIAKRKILMADEMGLGKTIMAIGWLNWLMRNEGISNPNVLVICPAKGVYQWLEELQKWLVEPLPVAVTERRTFPTTPVRIINYDKLWFFEAEIHACHWDLLIVDECHYLQNPRAERTVFVYGHDAEQIEPIPCDRAAFMTGTPIRNRPRELYPLLHYLDPQRWPTFAAYAKRYCGGELVKKRKGGMTVRSTGASNLEELQLKLRSTVMIRRLKRDVLTELPPKTRSIIELPSVGDIRDAVLEEIEAFRTHEQKITSLRIAVERAKDGSSNAKYKKAVSELRKQVSVSFREMSAFRKKTALLKSPYVIQHLENLLTTGIKVVCFGHHHEVLDKIQEHFDKEVGVDSVMITGATSPRAAKEAVDRFQTDPDCRLFLGGIISAGCLWTLTAAYTVVFAELDWVPGNISQAEDRVHRIGQFSAVLIQHLVLENSLDATIVRKVVAKQDIIDAALNTMADPQFTTSAPEPEGMVQNIPTQAQGTTTVSGRVPVSAYRDPSGPLRTQGPLQTTIQGPGIQPGPPQGPNRGVPLGSPGAGFPVSAPSSGLGPRAHSKPPSSGLGASPPDGSPPSSGPSGPAAIHECLRILSGICDGAHARDSKGFNGMDSQFGKLLAAKALLTDRMAYVGQNIVAKYKRQLPLDLYNGAMAWKSPSGAQQKKG